MALPYMLSLLKADLGYGNDVPKDLEIYLSHLLDASQAELIKMNIDIDEQDSDSVDLIITYAAEKYRGRISGRKRPWQIQRSINDAKLRSLKTKEGSG